MKNLTKNLNLTLGQVGWIMTSFGVGSLAGSWLGGRLTDKVGYYKVMVWSLLITGFLFIGLQFVKSFYGFAFAIFLTMTVADTFRPAMFVAIVTTPNSPARLIISASLSCCFAFNT